MEVNASQIFCFLTDINYKIIHVSENCASALGISANINQMDILIH